MNVVILLIGIVIAAALFAALLWSVYRSFTTTGRVRLVSLLQVISTLAGMATISFNLPAFAMLAGACCIIFGTIGIWTEARWSKLLPFTQALFGLALIARLPWA